MRPGIRSLEHNYHDWSTVQHNEYLLCLIQKLFVAVVYSNLIPSSFRCLHGQELIV